MTGILIADRALDGPHGPLPVRTYRPADANADAPGLVWVHGGAFFFGDLEMPEADWVSRELAARGVVVVSVDYQVSPVPASFAASDPDRFPPHDGVRFPVASEEVTAAFDWAVASDAGEGAPGAPASRPWSLGGGSAGGNLAAGAGMRMRDRSARSASGASASGSDASAAPPASVPHSLVLVYPLLHAELPAPAPELAAKIAALPAELRSSDETTVEINLNYVGDEALLAHPYAFPGGHDLAGLPPVFVLNADADALRRSGDAFAGELAAAGVDTLVIRETGTRHGHLNEPSDPAAARSLDRIADWLHSSTLVGSAHEPTPDHGAPR